MVRNLLDHSGIRPNSTQGGRLAFEKQTLNVKIQRSTKAKLLAVRWNDLLDRNTAWRLKSAGFMSDGSGTKEMPQRLRHKQTPMFLGVVVPRQKSD